MKSWNLSTFEDLSPTVLSSVDKDATVRLSGMRRRPTGVSVTRRVSVASAAFFVAAISLASPLQVVVCGSDNALRLTSTESISNIQSDRPPLGLLFGAKHALKWDAAKEAEMLAKAAASIAASTDKNNEANFIHAVLSEELPSDRENAVDLASLGIKLG
jgi:hypothetical protein